MSPARARAVRGASAILTLLTGVWGLWLAVFGGFGVTVFGLVVRSHDPYRPFLLCVTFATVFWLTGGRASVNAWVETQRPRARRVWEQFLAAFRRGHVHDTIAAALTIAMLIVGVANKSTAVGGSDSFGYVSEAELWLDGRLAIGQPWAKEVPWPSPMWTFSPLGYTPSRSSRFTLFGYSPAQSESAIVPVYSPGMPILMAIGKAVSGVCGPFFIVPIGGTILVLSTYLLGVRLGSRTLGLLAMLLMVTSPPVLLMNFQNMTDVPVAAALALASWCLLGATIRSAIGASIALVAALLIRPNLVPLAPVFVLWLGWRAWRERTDRWRHASRAVIVLAGIGAATLATLAIYWCAYGTPFESGYGATAPFFSLSHIAPNLRNYTQWFSEVHTPLVLLGLAALALPIARVWPAVVDRSALIPFTVITAIVVGEFLVYLVLDNSSYLRFLLVCYPFIMLGVASAAMATARVHRWIGPLAGAVVVVVLCAKGAWVSWEWRVFGQALLEAKYADTADHVRRYTPENSVVLAMQHSGSLRYYAGRVTLRWDLLDVEWLDRAVAWMAAHGVRTYALLDDFEQVEAVKRFKNQKLVAILEGPPIFRFGNKLFFDLGLPPGTPIETVTLPVVDIPPRCWMPAPPPAIAWKK